MSSLEETLLIDEEIVYRTRLRWIVFLWPLIISLCGVAIGSKEGVGILGLAAIVSIPKFISYKNSEFGLTDKRIILKTGFIRQNSHEILLAQIEGIQVEQGILGRILAFRSIVITGTGGAHDRYRKITAPLELRKRYRSKYHRVKVGQHRTVKLHWSDGELRSCSERGVLAPQG